MLTRVLACVLKQPAERMATRGRPPGTCNHAIAMTLRRPARGLHMIDMALNADIKNVRATMEAKLKL